MPVDEADFHLYHTWESIEDVSRMKKEEKKELSAEVRKQIGELRSNMYTLAEYNKRDKEKLIKWVQNRDEWKRQRKQREDKEAFYGFLVFMAVWAAAAGVACFVVSPAGSDLTAKVNATRIESAELRAGVRELDLKLEDLVTERAISTEKLIVEELAETTLDEGTWQPISEVEDAKKPIELEVLEALIEDLKSANIALEEECSRLRKEKAGLSKKNNDLWVSWIMAMASFVTVCCFAIFTRARNLMEKISNKGEAILDPGELYFQSAVQAATRSVPVDGEKAAKMCLLISMMSLPVLILLADWTMMTASGLILCAFVVYKKQRQ